MISFLKRRRHSPIGIDVGARSLKLVQLSADRTRIIDAARRELPVLPENATSEQQIERIVVGLREALESGAFRGRDAVICLNDRQLFLQNVRVPKGTGPDFERVVKQEAAGKVPFPIDEAEIRFVESADVRQGETLLREVIIFACPRTVLQQTLQAIDDARLRPVAVDVEPAALVRSYAGQSRREEDRNLRALMIHVGYTRTAAVVAQGDDLLFVKYIDVGGMHLDAAVARHLKMDAADAVALRRQNSDRRGDLQDPEVARGIAEATRPVIERLSAEISMCVRYHSVTFRGQPLVRMVLGGGEANQQLLDVVSKQLDLKCELSDPFRSLSTTANLGRRGQWDVAMGLALRELN